MGLGAGLALIAIGAILAFATDFSVSGIDVQLIGVILMVVGLASIAFTLLYVRPRRVGPTTLDEGPPVYVAEPEEPTLTARESYEAPPVQQHVHVHRDPREL
jgi:hypothetical protein